VLFSRGMSTCRRRRGPPAVHGDMVAYSKVWQRETVLDLQPENRQVALPIGKAALESSPKDKGTHNFGGGQASQQKREEDEGRTTFARRRKIRNSAPPGRHDVGEKEKKVLPSIRPPGHRGVLRKKSQ